MCAKAAFGALGNRSGATTPVLPLDRISTMWYVWVEGLLVSVS